MNIVVLIRNLLCLVAFLEIIMLVIGKVFKVSILTKIGMYFGYFLIIIVAIIAAILLLYGVNQKISGRK